MLKLQTNFRKNGISKLFFSQKNIGQRNLATWYSPSPKLRHYFLQKPKRTIDTFQMNLCLNLLKIYISTIPADKFFPGSHTNS